MSSTPYITWRENAYKTWIELKRYIKYDLEELSRLDETKIIIDEIKIIKKDLYKIAHIITYYSTLTEENINLKYNETEDKFELVIPSLDINTKIDAPYDLLKNESLKKLYNTRGFLYFSLLSDEFEVINKFFRLDIDKERETQMINAFRGISTYNTFENYKSYWEDLLCTRYLNFSISYEFDYVDPIKKQALIRESYAKFKPMSILNEDIELPENFRRLMMENFNYLRMIIAIIFSTINGFKFLFDKLEISGENNNIKIFNLSEKLFGHDKFWILNFNYHLTSWFSHLPRNTFLNDAILKFEDAILKYLRDDNKNLKLFDQFNIDDPYYFSKYEKKLILEIHKTVKSDNNVNYISKGYVNLNQSSILCTIAEFLPILIKLKNDVKNNIDDEAYY